MLASSWYKLSGGQMRALPDVVKRSWVSGFGSQQDFSRKQKTCKNRDKKMTFIVRVSLRTLFF